MRTKKRPEQLNLNLHTGGPDEPDDDDDWVYSAYITTRDGRRIYAAQRGLKAFRFRGRRGRKRKPKPKPRPTRKSKPKQRPAS